MRAMTEDRTRPMTPEERALLDFLLTDAIPDVATLRAQAADAMMTGSCSCGCPTVDLAPAGGAPSWDAGRVIGRVAASAFSRPGWPQAQLLLHVVDGRLAELELVDVDASGPHQVFPPPAAWQAPFVGSGPLEYSWPEDD